MEKLKNTTQRAIDYIWRYEHSAIKNIFEAYKSGCSEAKAEAFYDIEARMNNEGGRGLKIISHNGWYFVTAYKVVKNNIEKLIVDTPTNTFEIELA